MRRSCRVRGYVCLMLCEGSKDIRVGRSGSNEGVCDEYIIQRRWIWTGREKKCTGAR
jgi:hypothetical protein